jgi:hypothetical protein
MEAILKELHREAEVEELFREAKGIYAEIRCKSKRQSAEEVDPTHSLSAEEVYKNELIQAKPLFDWQIQCLSHAQDCRTAHVQKWKLGDRAFATRIANIQAVEACLIDVRPIILSAREAREFIDALHKHYGERLKVGAK